MSIEDEIMVLIGREAAILEISGKRDLPILLVDEIVELGYIDVQIDRLRRTLENAGGDND